MKKTIRILSLLGLLCAVGFTSCNKIKDGLFPAFAVQTDEVTVNIPVMVAAVESSTSSTVSFNLDSTIRVNTANTFGVDNVSSIKVKDITVFLTNSDALNDLSNFEKVRLLFSSNTVTTPAIVASADIPNSKATSINIPASNGPELKEYLKGNQLTHTVYLKARRTTTKPLNVAVSVTLSFK